MPDLNAIPVHDQPLAEPDHAIASVRLADGTARLRRLPRALLGVEGTATAYALGNILVSDAAGALQPLPIGAAGQVLVARSSAPLGMAWETPAPDGGDGDEVLTATNAAKLALPTDTAPGTRVDVTDAFYLDGPAASLRGFYFPCAVDNEGRAQFKLATNPHVTCFYFADKGGRHWRVHNGDTATMSNAQGGEEMNPWEALGWSTSFDGGEIAEAGDVSLQNPARQVFAEPSGELAAVFAEFDGITYGTFTKRGDADGRPFFCTLGNESDPNFLSFRWCSLIADQTGHGPARAGWVFCQSGTPVAFNLDDVSTPDQCDQSHWSSLGEEQFAVQMSIQPLLQRDLYAGINVAAANGGLALGTFVFSMDYANGRPGYASTRLLPADPLFGYFPWLDFSGNWNFKVLGPSIYRSLEDTIFPWQASYVQNEALPLGAPSFDAPLVSQSCVADERNWQPAAPAS